MFYNTAYYSNADVDKDVSDALLTTDAAKQQQLYADAQQRIWKDAPWIFLTTDRTLAAESKKLSGFYVMPDGSFNFSDVDLAQ